MIGIILALCGGAVAQACTFVAPAKIGVAAIPDYFPRADAVVLAVLERERADGYVGANRYDARIEKVWKGELKAGDAIVVSTRPYQTTCDVRLQPPHRMIMFLVRDGGGYRMGISQADANIEDRWEPSFSRATAELERLTARTPR